MEEKGANPADDAFISEMSDFHFQAEKQLQKITAKWDAVKQSFVDLLTAFCFPPVKIKAPKLDEFYDPLVPFLRQFKEEVDVVMTEQAKKNKAKGGAAVGEGAVRLEEAKKMAKGGDMTAIADAIQNNLD